MDSSHFFDMLFAGHHSSFILYESFICNLRETSHGLKLHRSYVSTGEMCLICEILREQQILLQ